MNGDKINIIGPFLSYKQELPAIVGWEQAILDVIRKILLPCQDFNLNLEPTARHLTTYTYNEMNHGKYRARCIIQSITRNIFASVVISAKKDKSITF